MIFVVMCGYPGSGKSCVVDQLFGDTDITILRPSDWEPENIDSMDEQWSLDYRVECWRTALIKAKELIGERKPFVLDQCNAKYHTVADIIDKAKHDGYFIATVFVHAPIKQCRNRKPRYSTLTYSNYTDDFRESLQNYKKISDVFVIVDNDKSVGDLQEIINKVRDKLCQNT